MDTTLILVWLIPGVTLAALIGTAAFYVVRAAVRDFRRED